MSLLILIAWGRKSSFRAETRPFALSLSLVTANAMPIYDVIDRSFTAEWPVRGSVPSTAPIAELR